MMKKNEINYFEDLTPWLVIALFSIIISIWEYFK